MPFITTSVGGDGSGLPGPQGEPGADGLGLTFKGEYSESATYFKNDIVSYNGSSYICNYDYDVWGATYPPSAGTVQDLWSILTGGANTGDITFDGVQIIGAGTASGDGYGLGTIELVPDGDITSDQYLIIDPTAPNHIHIRAGGAQDNSSAHLYLGAERNNIEVSDPYRTVKINTKPDGTENTYGNSNQDSNAEFMVVSGTDIIVGDTVRLYTGGPTYVVTAVTPEYPYAGLMTVLADGLSFITGESYVFTRDQGYNNQWTFTPDGTFEGPAMGGVKVLGLLNAGNNDLGLYANDADIVLQAGSGAVNIVAPEVNFTSNAAPSSVNINTYSGAIINSSRTSTYAPEDKVVATLGDIEQVVSPDKVRYTPAFTATGLAFTGSAETYPTYNSYYVKSGKMVSFVIEVDCSTVTDFGTGQFKVQLPFTPAVGFNHFTGWANVDTALNPDVPNGHIILNADHAGITDVLDIHYLKQAGGANSGIIEGLFIQGTPVTLTTSSKIYFNGTYIMQDLP